MQWMHLEFMALVLFWLCPWRWLEMAGWTGCPGCPADRSRKTRLAQKLVSRIFALVRF